MPALNNLPEALLSVIYSSWLTIVDVARLDSAVCQRESRKEFLSIAYRSGVTLQYQAVFRKELCDAINVWILKKDVFMSGIYATVVFMREHERRKQYLQKYGKAIRWIEYGHGWSIWPDQTNSEQSAMEVVRSCPNLVRFRGEHSHKENVLEALVENCPFLADIAVGGYTCSVSAMFALSRSCTKLKKVQLSSINVNEECLTALVRSNPDLVSFTAHCAGATNRLIRELASSCAGLVEVSLGSVSVTDATIHFLLKQCKNLRVLALRGCPVDDSTEGPEFTIHASMRELYLTNVDIDDGEILGLLQVCPGLTHLELRECSRLEQIDALHIGSHCPGLQELCLHDNPSVLNDAELIEISENCRDLRKLEIPESSDVSDESLIRVVMQCLLLSELDITGCMDVTDRSLSVLAEHARGLKVLEMYGCPKVTNAGVEAVRAACKAMQVICWDSA
jgi:hypothetical protein